MQTPFMNMTFCVRTFGCQMNKHDSERISGMLEGLGGLMVDTVEEADILVYMTCCVREAADTRLYGQVASLKNVPLRKDSPLKKRIIAVGGCIGQRDGEELTKKLPHLDVVFGTHNLASLPRLLQGVIEEGGHQVEVLDASSSFPTELPTAREHSWAAWLPITIGCNNFCTYCIVPYVRGREKSRPIEDIVAEAERYVAAGVKEITLLGQNVNSYGRDLYGSPRFAQILDALDQTGIERLRFATSHPKDLSDEVIAKFGKLRSLMPALHLPAQSGSDAVLKAMNRRYTSEHYLQLIDKLRDACPDIALSTDIIVGFPGETEQDFEDTARLVDTVGYHQVFTFIYSKREGTPAAKMVDNTPHEVIQQRFDRLVDIVQKHGPFAAARFRDQECPPGLVRVQRGGVDLHVVGVLERDVVCPRDAQRVAGEAREVRGTRVGAADAAGGPHGGLCADADGAPGCIMRKNAAATFVAAVARDDIVVVIIALLGGFLAADLVVFSIACRRFNHDVIHARVLKDAHVGKRAHSCQQLRGDFRAGGVVVETDARATVRAFARVAQLTRIVALEVHAVRYQIIDDAAAGANHQVDAFTAILEMARAQRVLEKRRVIVCIVLHANAALRQHGVAFVHGGFRQHNHGK